MNASLYFKLPLAHGCNGNEKYKPHSQSVQGKSPLEGVTASLSSCRQFTRTFGSKHPAIEYYQLCIARQVTFHYQHQHNYEPQQLHVCCVCMFEKGHVYLIPTNPSRRVHKNHMETASVIANTFLTSGLLGGGALSFAVVAIIKHGKWSLTRFARDVSHFRKLSLVTYKVPSLCAYMRELDQWLCVTIHCYLLEYILIACLFSLYIQFALRILTTELWSCCMLLCPNLVVYAVWSTVGYIVRIWNNRCWMHESMLGIFVLHLLFEDFVILLSQSPGWWCQILQIIFRLYCFHFTTLLYGFMLRKYIFIYIMCDAAVG